MPRSTAISSEISSSEVYSQGLQWTEMPLVGRESQASVMTQVLKASHLPLASPKAILLTGESGVGKSCLVDAVVPDSVHFGAGKFDQSVQISYSGAVSPVSSVLYQIASDERLIKELTAKFDTSFTDEEAQALLQVVPAVRVLKVEQRARNDSVPSEGMAIRFQTLFRRLLWLLATPEKPLILFFDDLQWADEGSRKLLNAILQDGELTNFVFLGAIRSGEDTTFEIPPDTAVEVTTLQCNCWNEEQVIDVVMTILESPDEMAAKNLGILLYRRTHGNPYFVKQYLDSLIDSDILHYDPCNEKYEWNMEAVERAIKPTDTVLGLLTSKIEALAPSLQITLAVASSLGHTFDADIVESLLMSTELVCLFPMEGQSAALSIDSRSLKRSLNKAQALGLIESRRVGAKEMFRFTHDRIQQATRSLVKNKTLQREILATTGSLLLELGERNKKETWITTTGTRLLLMNSNLSSLKLAELSLHAAKLSGDKVAFEDAAWFSDKGIGMLGDGCWSDSTYDLCLELHNISAESHGCATHLKTAKKRARTIQRNAKKAQDMFRGYNVLMDTLLTEKKFKEVIDEANGGLHALGFGPAKPGKFHAFRTIINARTLLKGRTAQDLTDLRPMEDKADVKQAMHLVVNLGFAAWGIGDNLGLVQTAFKPLALTLEHGIGPLSAYAFNAYGGVLMHQGKLEDGYDFAELCLQTLDRDDVKHERACLARVSALMGAIHFKKSLHEVVEEFRVAEQLGASSGEFFHASVALPAITTAGCMGLTTLPRLEIDIRKALATIRSFKIYISAELLSVWQRFNSTLLAKADHTADLARDEAVYGDDVSSERIYLENHKALMILLFLKGDHKMAKRIHKKHSQRNAKEAFDGHFTAPFYNFAVVMNALLCGKKIKLANKQFQAVIKYANCGSIQGRALLSLLNAEMDKNSSTAFAEFKNAINLMNEAKLRLWEAVAYERLGKRLLACNYRALGNQSIHQAYVKYKAHGVTLKTDLMESTYDFLN